MAESKQSQGIWKRLKPVAWGLLAAGTGTVLLYGGTYAVLSMENYINKSLRDNNPVSYNISQLPKDIIEENPQQQLDNPVILYQTNPANEKLLMSPQIISTFIIILFTVSGGGLAILFTAWGVGLNILNTNNNNRTKELKDEMGGIKKEFKDEMGGIKKELKEDHNKLSNKIDKLIESQKTTPIITSQS